MTTHRHDGAGIRGPAIVGMAALALVIMAAGCHQKPPARPSPAVARLPADPGLLDVAGRWRYPTVVGYRPADGAVADVNPPRFSWPYLAGTLPPPGGGEIPQARFDLQISAAADFSSPAVEVSGTPYNFHNALAPLAPGSWHWRVRHHQANEARWSDVRTFVIAADTPIWDRSVFTEAPARMGALPHPRLGPADGDWAAWRQRLEASPLAASLVRQMRSDHATLLRTLGQAWAEMPASDAQPPEGTHITELKRRTNEFVNLGRACALGAYLWRVTGEAQYAEAKPRLLALAAYPPGGVSSPEAMGGHTKMATQLLEFMATGYDVLHDRLSAEERQAILAALDWRLRATFLGDPRSRNCSVWLDGANIATNGVAICAHSHPYQNLMWATGALPLLAGDLPLADELLPMALNYHAGVTAAHGPDEGWTEGAHYATEKSETMMHAARVLDLMMPELRMGPGNPMIPRLAVWLAQILPIGLQRQPFGDLHSLDFEQANRNHTGWLWLNAEVTGSPVAEAIHRRYVAEYGPRLPQGLYSRPWVDAAAAVRVAAPPAGASVAANHLFLDGGWVTVNSQPLAGREAFRDTVGMIFQARPSGGFSHSYASDGSFVWYAYGQTLAAGGGSLFYPDPFPRETIAHNVMLIDGQGQTRIDERRPYAPAITRIVAYREEPGLVAWAADLTQAYPAGFDDDGQPRYELAHYLRHVLFIDNRWFAIYDDLAMASRPARFSWLYHADAPTPLALGPEDGVLKAMYTVGDVSAELVFATPPDALEWLNLTGRDGFRNPITGKDVHARSKAALWQTRRFDLDKMTVPHNNLWITNREPALRHAFLAALVPARAGEGRIRIVPLSSHRLQAEYPDGSRKTIAFDDWAAADIRIDAALIRRHAHDTRQPE